MPYNFISAANDNNTCKAFMWPTTSIIRDEFYEDLSLLLKKKSIVINFKFLYGLEMQLYQFQSVFLYVTLKWYGGVS